MESLRIPELPVSTVCQRSLALRRVIEAQAEQAAGPATADSAAEAFGHSIAELQIVLDEVRRLVREARAH